MSRRRWLVPEVVQTAATDCGPAALGSLLTGFGVRVSYGRLREACQTDVDGTSIDTVEEVAVALGLDAAQVVVPLDHVLRAEAGLLPAIAVLRLPNGQSHFVVLWSVLGAWVQVMDPGAGRLWIPRAKLIDSLYVHAMRFEAADWRAWAEDDGFLRPLRSRIEALGCTAQALLEPALAEAGAHGLAGLDAAVRLVAELVESKALERGREAQRTIASLWAKTMALDGESPTTWIPARYWTAAPIEADGDDDAQVLLRGAVLVRVRGLREAPKGEQEPAVALPPDLAIARNEDPPSPTRTLVRMLVADGWLTPGLVLLSLAFASVASLVEVVLLRGLVELGVELRLIRERLVAWAALVVFTAVLLLLEAVLAGELLGIGRRLEARLRVAFLTKVPRLGARYFQSRLSSDMAERIHAMHGLRRVPELGAELVRTVCSLLLTVVGIAWLDPGGAVWAAVAALVLLTVTFAAFPAMAERDLRFRTHGGALGRVHLDALLGLVPIRTHGAGRAVTREHEQLLVEWMRAGFDLVRASVTVETLQAIVGFAIVIAITLRHSLASGEIGAMLLLVYWSLLLPQLGQRVGELVLQYPAHRSRTMRLLEPIGAPDEDPELGAPPDPGRDASPDRPRGVAIAIEDVSVVAAGTAVLTDVSLHVAPGEHVAIVGPSGAGKSSLVGLLLGWHRPVGGELRVDGERLDGHRLSQLRRETAWVDPAVVLWNQSLADNLLYGTHGVVDEPLEHVGRVLHDADLLELVSNLPEGLQTELGEAGALLSGGEGQRVRLGRALLRTEARLVLLDEPLRGLDRERRTALLRRIRAWWPAATLLCVSHDLEETREFPRVIVMADGKIVEDGAPEQLLAAPEGVYATMLAHERSVHAQLWRRASWRRLHVADGVVHELDPAGEQPREAPR